MLKVNVDAATFKELECVDFGVVVHDEHGIIKGCAMKEHPRLAPAKIAEALALKWSLKWVQEASLGDVLLVEVDCLEVYLTWRKQREVFTEFQTLILDVKVFTYIFNNF